MRFFEIFTIHLLSKYANGLKCYNFAVWQGKIKVWVYSERPKNRNIYRIKICRRSRNQTRCDFHLIYNVGAAYWKHRSENMRYSTNVFVVLRDFAINQGKLIDYL